VCQADLTDRSTAADREAVRVRGYCRTCREEFTYPAGASASGPGGKAKGTARRVESSRSLPSASARVPASPFNARQPAPRPPTMPLWDHAQADSVVAYLRSWRAGMPNPCPALTAAIADGGPTATAEAVALLTLVDEALRDAGRTPCGPPAVTPALDVDALLAALVVKMLGEDPRPGDTAEFSRRVGSVAVKVQLLAGPDDAGPKEKPTGRSSP
jgi:hypothetical protein